MYTNVNIFQKYLQKVYMPMKERVHMLITMQSRGKLAKKTQVRAIRFEEETISQLENLAADESISFNGFVNHVLNEYIDYVHPAKQDDSKLIHGEIVKKMIDLIEAEQLAAMAREVGKENFSRIIASGWAPNDLDFFKKIVRELFCHCANWARYNESHLGNKTLINLSHHTGLRWSEFLQNFFSWEISKLTDVKNADVAFIGSENSLIISFPYAKPPALS